MRILVFIPTWKRAHITKLCFFGLERLKKSYDIMPLIVVSDSDNERLAREFGYLTYWHENFPFGKKKNDGVRHSLKYDYDYLMELNSDGLITNRLMDMYIEKMEAGTPAFGTRNVHFIESRSKETKFFQYATSQIIGSGRCYSRDTVEKVMKKGGFWHDRLNKGLDNDSQRALKVNHVKAMQVDPGRLPGIIDVKSEVNIWPFEIFACQPAEIEDITEHLSKEETDYLLSI